MANSNGGASGSRHLKQSSRQQIVICKPRNSIGTWIDDGCEIGANHWEAITKLFASWKAWAELAGEFVGSQKQFSEKLEARGLTPEKRHPGTRGYRGIQRN